MLEGDRVRFAAIADLHVRVNDPGPVLSALPTIAADVDVMLIAGDITEHGRLAEACIAADVLARLPVPVFAVLGNHDLRTVWRASFRQILLDAGIRLLDGASDVVSLHTGLRVGLAGISGCGGGFWPAAMPDAIPARAWNTVAVRQRREATKLDQALTGLEADVRIVLMHFAPTASTLGSEPGMKYWMLGNGELGRVIDRHRVDLVLHGHAHLGNPSGATRAGVPVHNVAYPVRRAVTMFTIDERRQIAVAPPVGVLAGAWA